MLRAGWTYINGDQILWRLLANATTFGGAIMMVTPLLAVLMLRELGFAAWQYGLALLMFSAERSIPPPARSG